MDWSRLRYIFPVVVLLVTTACNSVSWLARDKPRALLPEDESGIENVSAQTLSFDEKMLYNKQHWQMSGRISITSETRVWSGALRWQQNNKAFVLSLNAPLGQGALQLKGDDIGVELKTADGKSLMADDVDSLFEDEIGWQLPVTNLRYWIFGIPSRFDDSKIKRDKQFRINQIEQADWQVNISRFQQVGEIELPRKLLLYNKEFRIRLVIDRWNLQSNLNEMADLKQAPENSLFSI